MDITGVITCYSQYNKNNESYWTKACYGAFYKDPDNYGEESSTMDQSTSATADSSRKVSFKASKSWTGETSSVGSNIPIDIMPPYITAYCWKRIS